MNEISDYSIGRVLLEDKNIAFVTVPNENKGSNSKKDTDKPVGAYIPKLMSEIKMGDKPWIKPRAVSSSMVINSNIPIKFDPIVKHRNYYNVTPLRTSNIEQPFLQKGEHFWVKFLDGDIKKGVYESQFMDESLRANDRYRVFIKDKAKATSENKEYEIVMDSDEQIIRLFMDNGRGEKAQFTLEMNGKQGTLSARDEKGNAFTLNSTSATAKMENAGGCYIDMTGANMKIYAPGRLDLNEGGG